MTITEVSKKYDISVDTLRYYEKIGVIPKVPRTKGGIRNYSDDDCRWVEFSKCMRSAGVQIEALIEYVSLFQMGKDTENDRKQILIGQKNRLEEKLLEMNTAYTRLVQKIEDYDKILNVERTLRKK